MHFYQTQQSFCQWIKQVFRLMFPETTLIYKNNMNDPVTKHKFLLQDSDNLAT